MVYRKYNKLKTHMEYKHEIYKVAATTNNSVNQLTVYFLMANIGTACRVS